MAINLESGKCIRICNSEIKLIKLFSTPHDDIAEYHEICNFGSRVVKFHTIYGNCNTYIYLLENKTLIVNETLFEFEIDDFVCTRTDKTYLVVGISYSRNEFIYISTLSMEYRIINMNLRNDVYDRNSNDISITFPSKIENPKNDNIRSIRMIISYYAQGMCEFRTNKININFNNRVVSVLSDIDSNSLYVVFQNGKVYKNLNGTDIKNMIVLDVNDEVVDVFYGELCSNAFIKTQNKMHMLNTCIAKFEICPDELQFAQKIVCKYNVYAFVENNLYPNEICLFGENSYYLRNPDYVEQSFIEYEDEGVEIGEWLYTFDQYSVTEIHRLPLPEPAAQVIISSTCITIITINYNVYTWGAINCIMRALGFTDNMDEVTYNNAKIAAEFAKLYTYLPDYSICRVELNGEVPIFEDNLHIMRYPKSSLF